MRPLNNHFSHQAIRENLLRLELTVRDALLKLKGNLELLGASISHGKNIPVEAKDAMMKLKNSLNDRVRKLVEKDLFGWLPGEVKPREVPGGKP